MQRSIPMPKVFHEILGRAQTPADLMVIAAAAIGLGVAIGIAGGETLAAVPLWRAVLAGLLIVDIAAGCVANFTPGTDQHYATRPISRWVFIAVHWHLVAIGALLGVAVVPLLLVTVYVLLSAAVVNLLHGSRSQVGIGGALMAIGIVGVVIWMPASAPLFLVATAALFVVKVVFAFGVAHHGVPEKATTAPRGVRA
ncbi:hypothetical protein ABS642_15010 [Microbacterium sp. A8/3-1]|uniref:Uncharacterized protein n=1 Tax=Microbacterium sp. A8/3-1 TaxID=3160749 RepID=A0AAU7VSN9_9MICO